MLDKLMEGNSMSSLPLTREIAKKKLKLALRETEGSTIPRIGFRLKEELQLRRGADYYWATGTSNIKAGYWDKRCKVSGEELWELCDTWQMSHSMERGQQLILILQHNFSSFHDTRLTLIANVWISWRTKAPLKLEEGRWETSKIRAVRSFKCGTRLSPFRAMPWIPALRESFDPTYQRMI